MVQEATAGKCQSTAAFLVSPGRDHCSRRCCTAKLHAKLATAGTWRSQHMDLNHTASPRALLFLTFLLCLLCPIPRDKASTKPRSQTPSIPYWTLKVASPV